MLQLLCLIAMEPPASLNADRVRDEKLKVLRALRPIPSHQIAAATPPCSCAVEPPRHYAAGSWGPTASIALIERDGRTWNEDAT